MFRGCLLALVLCCFPSLSNAATVTRSYQGNYVFDEGPIDRVIVEFSLTFDPQATYTFGSSFIEFSSNSSFPAFQTKPVSFRLDHVGDLHELVFSGLADGEGVAGGANDILGFFYVDAMGYATNRFTRLGYSGGGYADVFVSPNVPGVSTIRNVTAPLPVAPVPEPATWAMMIIGLGGIGFAMRRKRKGTARVAFA